MPRPQYPTSEGHWSRRKRREAGYSAVRLGTPYPDAVESLRKAVEGRPDFDPSVLFVWGTMQATAVLNVLKAVEETFGVWRDGKNPRHAYSEELMRRAIQKLSNPKRPSDEPAQIHHTDRGCACGVSGGVVGGCAAA